MSATHAIFFGFALGLTAGSTVAIAVAQDATVQNETSFSVEAGTDAGLALGVETDAEVDVTATGETGADDNMTDPAAADAGAAAASDIVADVALDAGLVGARVHDANDDWIGEISAVLASEVGTEASVVIDVGGFLGFGEKSVIVALDKISVKKDADGEIEYVTVAMTEAELQAMPEAQM
jgi:hypothetical protein